MAERQSKSRLITCKLTNTVTKNTIDLINIVRQVNIYNSLEVMCTTGDVQVLDQGNMIEEYKLNGREILDIEIHANDTTAQGASNLSEDENVYKRRFFVYAIDSVVGQNDQMAYVIRFIDQFALINTDTRISFHYTKKKGEDIISQINKIVNSGQNNSYKNVINNSYASSNCNQNGTDLFPFKKDVSTKYEFDLTVPMWKPFELIRYISDRIISSENTSEWSDCVFYQDKKGVYHINSFRNIFNQANQLKFAQQLTGDVTQEPSHLVESYSFNKIYNAQVDKLNGIYGMQFAISDFKPETKTVSATTVLGTNIISKSDEKNGPQGNMSLHDTIIKYFGNQLGSINLGGVEAQSDYNSNPSKARMNAGLIDPFKCDSIPNLKSNQIATTKGNSQTIEYNNQTGALIYLDACGIIHVNDTEYDEYKKFTLPHVKGIVMKKVLGTYVINCVMNGSLDVDLGKSFVLNMAQPTGITRQLSAFVNGVVWMVTNYRHYWDSENMELKTYVTGITPFLKRGDRATI